MADSTTTPTNTIVIPEQTPLEDFIPQTPVNEEELDEELLDEELEEELIIEDFTIDGICGVY